MLPRTTAPEACEREPRDQAVSATECLGLGGTGSCPNCMELSQPANEAASELVSRAISNAITSLLIFENNGAEDNVASAIVMEALEVAVASADSGKGTEPDEMPKVQKNLRMYLLNLSSSSRGATVGSSRRISTSSLGSRASSIFGGAATASGTFVGHQGKNMMSKATRLRCSIPFRNSRLQFRKAFQRRLTDSGESPREQGRESEVNPTLVDNSTLDLRTACALGYGALVLLHAFILPYRAAFVSASWGEIGHRRARDDPSGHLLEYCLTLYLVDAACVCMAILPMTRQDQLEQSRRMRALMSAVRVNIDSSLNAQLLFRAGSLRLHHMILHQSQQKLWAARLMRVCLGALELARRYGAWIPVDAFVLVTGASLNTWSAVALLRLLRLTKLSEAIKASYRLLRYRAALPVGWARLLSYLPIYLLLLHLVACGFIALGRLHDDRRGWPYHDAVLAGREHEPSKLYARAIYWSVVTMSTVGYGDIIPLTLEEMLYTCVVMFMGAYVAYTAIGLIMAELGRADVFAASWQRRVELADLFIRKRPIPLLLARRIQTYLKYQWAVLRGVDESAFFDALPATLRSEVLVFLNASLLRRIPEFETSCEEEIASLASMLCPLLFLPGEVMIGGLDSEGTQVSEAAWLLVRGRVNEYGHHISRSSASDTEKSSEVGDVRKSFFSPLRRSSGSTSGGDAERHSSLSDLRRICGQRASLAVSGFKRRSSSVISLPTVRKLTQFGFASTKPQLLRTYEEGDCILPMAAFQLVQVRTNIIAATFVEVHALRAADVRTVLRARRLKADEEKRQKSDQEAGDLSPSRVEDPDSSGSPEEQQRRWSKHSSIIRKFVSRQGSVPLRCPVPLSMTKRQATVPVQAAPGQAETTDDLRKSWSSGLSRVCAKYGSASKLPVERLQQPADLARGSARSKPDQLPNAEFDLPTSLENSSMSSFIYKRSFKSLMNTVNYESHAMAAAVSRKRRHFVRDKLSQRNCRAFLSVGWLCLRLTSLGMMAVLLPLRIAVSPTLLSIWWLFADLAVDFVIILVLLTELTGVGARMLASLNMNTMTSVSGHSPPPTAFQKALKGILLLVDLCASIPVEIVLYTFSPLPETLPLAMLPRMVVFRRGGAWLKELSELLHEAASDYDSGHGRRIAIFGTALLGNRSVRKMGFLCANVLVVCHWVACGWLALPLRVEDEFDTSWLGADAVLAIELKADDNLWGKYTRSLYWVIVSVATIGFGDIVPTTFIETAYSILVLLIGAHVYPAVVGAIATILTETLTATAQEKVPTRDYVRRAGLPPQLGRQIITFTTLSQSVREESMLLRSLPPALRLQVSAHLYQDMVRSVKCFMGCPTPFLLEVRNLRMRPERSPKVCSLLVTELFVPDSHIVSAGDEAQTLIFIESGSAERRAAAAERVSDDKVVPKRRRCTVGDHSRSACADLSRFGKSSGTGDEGQNLSNILSATRRRASNVACRRLSLFGPSVPAKCSAATAAPASSVADSSAPAASDEAAATKPHRKSAPRLCRCLIGEAMIDREGPNGPDDDDEPQCPLAPQTHVSVDLACQESSRVSSLQEPSILAVVRSSPASEMDSVRDALVQPKSQRKSVYASYQSSKSSSAKNLLEVLSVGDHFGAESFVLGVPHKCDLIAAAACECLMLYRRPFQQLLRRFPQLVQNIKENAETLLPMCDQRDNAILSNFVTHRKLSKVLVAEESFALRSLLFYQPSLLSEESRKRLLDQLRQGLTLACVRARSSTWWTLLVIAVLLYQLLSGSYRAALPRKRVSVHKGSLVLTNSSVRFIANTQFGAGGGAPLLVVDLFADLLLAFAMLFVWDWQPTVDTAFGAKEKTLRSAQKATDSAGLLSKNQSALRADGMRNKLWVFTAFFSVTLLILDIAVLVCMEFFELDDVPSRLQDLFEALWFFRWFFLLVLPSHIARIEAIVNENFLSVSIAQVRLGRLGLIIALLAHLASCVWAAVGWYGLENDADSWVDHDRVIREEVLAGTSAALIAWLRGFYYAASTYMVIVIGDVTPRTMNETGYTLVLVLLGASVNSSILGLIVSVVANVDKEKHEQATVHKNADKFMAEHGLPSALRQRVHRYLSLSHNSGANREAAIFQQLPPPLLLEAANHLRLKLLSQSELSRVLPPSALSRLTLELTGVVVPPGELLLLEGDVCSTSMYVVVEGQFEVLFTRSVPPPQSPMVKQRESTSAISNSVGGEEENGRSSAASTLVDYAVYSNNPQRELSQFLQVATLGPGATLGAASFLLDDIAPSASVRAMRRSYVFELERSRLEGLLIRRGIAKDRNHLEQMDRELRQINQRNREKNEGMDNEDARRNSRKFSVSQESSNSNIPRRKIFTPETSVRRGWDLLMVLVLTYLALSFPFLVATCNGVNNQLDTFTAWIALGTLWAADIVLVVDSFLNATRFPFLGKDREVFMASELLPLSIWRHYKACKLRLDLLATPPYEIFAIFAWAAGLSEQRLLFVVICLRAPKLLRCHRIQSHVRSASSFLPSGIRFSEGEARLLAVTALYLLIWHVFACLWLLVAYARPEDSTESTWMSVEKDADAEPTRPALWAHTSLWTSYARALYFTITLLSTVGYGDVRPQNALETVLTVVLALCASVSCAGLIALISSLVRLADVQEEALKSQLDFVMHFFERHKLPQRLRKRISSYYKIIWYNARVGKFARQIEGALPHFLLRDVRLAIYRDAITSIPAFSSLTFFPLKEICLLLRPEIFLEGDVVFARGDDATRLCLVDVGKLKAMGKRKDLHSAFIGRGEIHMHVGEEMLYFMEHPAKYRSSVVAVIDSHLVVLELAQWQALCKLFPQELQPIAEGKLRESSDRRRDSAEGESLVSKLRSPWRLKRVIHRCSSRTRCVADEEVLDRVSAPARCPQRQQTAPTDGQHPSSRASGSSESIRARISSWMRV